MRETPEEFVKSHSKDFPYQCSTRGTELPKAEEISQKGFGSYIRVPMDDDTITWGFTGEEILGRFQAKYGNRLVGSVEVPEELEEKPQKGSRKRKVIQSKKPVKEKPIKKLTKEKPVKEKLVKKSSGGTITVSDIASKLGMVPRQARAILRKSKLEKPDGGWSWNPNDAKKIEKLLKDNK